MNAHAICECGNAAELRLCSYSASTLARFETAHELFGKLKGRSFCRPCMSILYDAAAAHRVHLLRENMRRVK